MGFQVAYVPIGVGTFHLESAQDQFEKSVSMLRGLTADCAVPEKMLLTINDLDAYLDTISPDLIVLQNITFANAAYASEVLKRFDCPIVLWTLREPVIDGTRLRLNSLTGAYSAGNAITAFRGEGRFEYIFGAPTEEEVKAEIGAAIRAAKVKYDLRRLKMISIGHTPQGFGFGRALDAEMMSTFGTTLDSIEARELINKAKGYTEDELAGLRLNFLFQIFEEILFRFDDRTGVGNQAFSERCKGNLTRVAVKQGNLQLLFQLFDMLAQRRFVHKKKLRGFPEILRFYKR